MKHRILPLIALSSLLASCSFLPTPGANPGQASKVSSDFSSGIEGASFDYGAFANNRIAELAQGNSWLPLLGPNDISDRIYGESATLAYDEYMDGILSGVREFRFTLNDKFWFTYQKEDFDSKVTEAWAVDTVYTLREVTDKYTIEEGESYHVVSEEHLHSINGDVSGESVILTNSNSDPQEKSTFIPMSLEQYEERRRDFIRSVVGQARGFTANEDCRHEAFDRPLGGRFKAALLDHHIDYEYMNEIAIRSAFYGNESRQCFLVAGVGNILNLNQREFHLDEGIVAWDVALYMRENLPTSYEANATIFLPDMTEAIHLYSAWVRQA